MSLSIEVTLRLVLPRAVLERLSARGRFWKGVRLEAVAEVLGAAQGVQTSVRLGTGPAKRFDGLIVMAPL